MCPEPPHWNAEFAVRPHFGQAVRLHCGKTEDYLSPDEALQLAQELTDAAVVIEFGAPTEDEAAAFLEALDGPDPGEDGDDCDP